jgi:hypothetical protein
MFRTLQLRSGNMSTELSWNQLVENAKYLIPKTIISKMELVLRAIAP